MTIWTINLYILIAAVIITLLLAQIRKPKSYVIEFLKNFIGAYFVFSGFVKAVDPVGTAIKMEEYFEIFHDYFPFLNFLWDILEPNSLGFSVFTILIEILLGLFLIFGAFPFATTVTLFATIVFFTFLTGFSHITGQVTDCGCFGDFLLLTPKVSFIKDIFLILLCLPLLVYWKKISPLFQSRPRALSLLILTILAIVFSLRNVHYEPIFDFRAYKVGVNIVECLNLPPDAKQYIYENIFIYQNADGEEHEFTVDNFPDDLENWTFIDRKDKLIQKGDDPKCKDFAIFDSNSNDLTELYMNEEQPLFVVIIPELKKLSSKNIEHVRSIITSAQRDGNKAIALTGSNLQDVQSTLSEYGIMIDVFGTDETPLKTIIRSNPGIIVLKKGTILGKYHHNDEVSYKDIKESTGI
ncbi:MAG TPA: BT_3928 family protein [Chitinophagales bacterium]|nr:BT_3928 family protein [Chitinophagales bacterium]